MKRNSSDKENVLQVMFVSLFHFSCCGDFEGSCDDFEGSCDAVDCWSVLDIERYVCYVTEETTVNPETIG